VGYQDILVLDVNALLKEPGLTVIDMRDEASHNRDQLPGALPYSDEGIDMLLRRRRTNLPV
jgi:hypothetical protein